MLDRSVPSYRLDELGWLQFNRLCDSLFPAAERPLNVVPLWTPGGRPPEDRVTELADRLRALLPADGTPGETLVLSNLPSEHAARIVRDLTGGRDRRTQMIGAGEICARLDGNPATRGALPSMLGLRDIGALIDSKVAERSNFDLARAINWLRSSDRRARGARPARLCGANRAA